MADVRSNSAAFAICSSRDTELRTGVSLGTKVGGCLLGGMVRPEASIRWTTIRFPMRFFFALVIWNRTEDVMNDGVIMGGGE